MVSYTMMKKLNFSLLLTTILVNHLLYAQFNIEDGEGRTSIGYNREINLGTVLFNTQDQKVKFDYYHYFNNANDLDFILGVTAEGKIKNDISNLFTGDNLTPESKLGAAFGWRFYNSTNDIDWEKWPDLSKEEKDKFIDGFSAKSDGWLFLRGNFTGSKFKLFSEDSAFNAQFVKENFSGFELDIGVNYYNANFLNRKIVLIAGLALGPQRVNNLADLTEKTFTDNEVVFNPDSSVVREIEREQNAWVGEYKTRSRFQLKADILIIPHCWNRVGLLGYYRLFDSSVKNDAIHNIGVGLYFFKEDTNFTPLGGINIGYNNLAENNDGERELTISLVTAFNIFVKQ